VHEYFSQLKNKIDLTKEQYIEMIEEKYDLIIQEVIQLENECKLNAKNKVNDLAKLIEEMEIKLNKRNESLKILKLGAHFNIPIGLNVLPINLIELDHSGGAIFSANPLTFARTFKGSPMSAFILCFL
jgi:hypothetical protein